MTTEQFYLGISIPAVIAFLGIMTSLVTFFVNNSSLNKRLDGIDKRLDRMEFTMDAMRQDIADIKVNQRGRDVEIANIKDRLKG